MYTNLPVLRLQWFPSAREVFARYNNQTVNFHVPESAGVYILHRYRREDSLYYSFYVGQANNLRRRLLEHLSPNECNISIRNTVDMYPCGFQYALISHPVHRDSAEAAIYHNHPDWYTCNNPTGLPSLNLNYIVDIGF
jgi:hypothetical protein